MSNPRLDHDQLSPDFDEDDDDEDGGLLDRFDFDAAHWQAVRQLLRPTPTFTTLVVYGFLAMTAMPVFAFLGFVLHPAFNAVAMILFVLMFPAGFFGVLGVVSYKAIQ